jgi:hypothetical protein
MTDQTKTLPGGEPNKVNGTATVVVGCKLPNGLILEMGRPGDGEDYTRVLLKGPRGNCIQTVDGNPVVGGFGLTTVSKAFWDAWFKRNQKMKFIRDGHVFVHENVDRATGHAKERADLRTGLEALDPNAPVLGRALDGTEVRVEVDAEHFSRAKMRAENLAR